MRKLIADQNIKLHEQEMRYRTLEETSQQQIQFMQKELSEKISENLKLKEDYKKI